MTAVTGGTDGAGGVVDVLAPVTGQLISMSEVPDPVFAASLVGPGAAVQPASDGSGPSIAIAPVSGTVVKLHPHAYVVQTADGAGVLTHLGIDTVQLAGEGFTLKVAEGDSVTAGDPMVEWDPAAVVASGRSAVVPVVALEGAPESVTVEQGAGSVEAGSPLFVWRR